MPNTSAAGGSTSPTEVPFEVPHVRRPFHLAKRRHARIEILTGEVLWLPYEKETTIMLDLFTEACKYCGVAETDFFGMAIREYDAEWYQFIDLSEKVAKFKRKRSILSKKDGEGPETKTPLFHFRLAYYVPCHVLPRDRGTKRQYYLQLRRNLREFNLFQPDDQLVSLVLYALQADFGPFGPHLLTSSRVHTPISSPTAAVSPPVNSTPASNSGSPTAATTLSQSSRADSYFDPTQYFPRWMVDKFGDAYFLTHVPPLHAGLGVMSRSEAEFHFIRQCSALPAASYNMHCYRLRLPPATGSIFGWLSAAKSLLAISSGASSADSKPLAHETSPSKSQTQSEMVWLGISPNGLELFERTVVDGNTFRSHVSSIAWHEIGKLRFSKTHLEVRVLVESSARTESASRKPVFASLHADQLQLVNLTVRGDPPANDASVRSSSVSGSVSTSFSMSTSGSASVSTPATRPLVSSNSTMVERVLVFCTESTAQSAHILELAKLQHVFQVKASLRAPLTADAVELAERSRYRESLVSSNAASRSRTQTAPASVLDEHRLLSTPPTECRNDDANVDADPRAKVFSMTNAEVEVESGLGTLETEPERDRGSPVVASTNSTINHKGFGAAETDTGSR